MYMHQYSVSKFPTKSLDAYSQANSETRRELCHHIAMADADQQWTSGLGPYLCLERASRTALLVPPAEYSHTRLEGKAAV